MHLRAALSTTHCGQTAGLLKPRFRAFSFFVWAAVMFTATMCVARRSRESQTRPPPATTNCSRSSAGGSVSPSIQTTQPANQCPSVRLRWSSSFRRFAAGTVGGRRRGPHICPRAAPCSASGPFVMSRRRRVAWAAAQGPISVLIYSTSCSELRNASSALKLV